MKPVLCLGDVCPDIILPYGETKAVMEAAARGEAVDAPQRGASIQPGGSVGNTAAGMARLGTPVLFAGTAGDDSLGRMLRDDLAREGVDVSLLRLDPQIATIMILVVVEADGGRVPFALPPSGASHLQLVPEQLPGDLPRRISWAHTTGMNLTEEPAAAATLDFLAACKAAGVPVSLDINSRIESMGNPRFLENLRRAADCCTVLLGSGPDELMPLAGADSPEAAARQLTRPGRAVVCRMGAGGATVYADGGSWHQDAFPVAVADTIGAGDAYNSGYLAAVWRGLAPREANRWGCAAGSACTSVRGARGCPTLPKLLDLLAQG